MLALIGKKMGMTQMFDGGRHASARHVIAGRAEHGRPANGPRTRTATGAVVLGAEHAEEAPRDEALRRAVPEGIEPTRLLREFRDFERECKVGDRLGRRGLRGRALGGRAGHEQGQGLPGRGEAPRLRGRPGAARLQVPPRARLDRAPAPSARSTKGRKMPGRMGSERVTVAEPARSCASTPRRGCCSSGAPSPAAAAAMVVVQKAIKRVGMRMKTQVYRLDGTAAREIELADAVFDREPSEGSIYHAIRNELANQRIGTASTKTRGEVQGHATRSRGGRRAPAGRARATATLARVGRRRQDLRAQAPGLLLPACPARSSGWPCASILSPEEPGRRLRVVEDFTVAERARPRTSSRPSRSSPPGERTVIVLGGRGRPASAGRDGTSPG